MDTHIATSLHKHIKILDALNQKDAKELCAFIDDPSVTVVDDLTEQLEELYCVRHPQTMVHPPTEKELNAFTNELTGNKSESFGFWVYYPWNHHLVHVLPEPLHYELRTARNRNLITAREQDRYYNATIGIVGLSVGNSVAATLVYTGGPKHMRLADHDRLSLSNLNRIRTGIHNVGKKKVDIAAEEILSVNPFAQLSLYPDGLDPDRLEAFLLNPDKLDVLVEEMDSIYLKIQIRFLARMHRIPVVMAADNGDNVVLDIERFDQDGEYPLFHGDVPESELLAVSPKTPKKEAARIITRWVHPENVAIRMQMSLFELGKTLYSWPQLGNAAFLAGCAVTLASRRILLGEDMPSGKYLISLDETLTPDFNGRKQQNERAVHTKKLKDMLNL